MSSAIESSWGRQIGCGVALAIGLLLAGPAAATVIHGDFAGTNVDFLGVQETTQTAGDPEPLYGAPTVAGDSLLFFPDAFTATATGAGGADTILSLLETTIMSSGTETIEFVKIQEFGDTTLSGTGTAVTQTSVAMSGFITVTEVDGSLGFSTPCFVDFGAACIIGFAGTITPGSTFDLPSDPGTTLWSGLVDEDISALGATKLVLSFNNQLDAFSETSSSATIQKKVVPGPSVIISVPEPGTLVMMAAGLSGLLLATPRRRR